VRRDGDAVSKGPDAFRTISEVADELDLPQHVLRFWETRFAQIKPLKRGGGRRYYRPDDVDLLRGIRHLLYGEGYTIRGVQRILHEQGQRFVVSAGRGETVGLEALAGSGDGGHAFGVGDRTEPTMPFVLDQMRSEGEEPTFDPREFRPAPHEGNGGNGNGNGDGEHGEEIGAGDERLTNDEVHRLRATLSELLELKRLLDQAR
jgi:DNA-binding transcriptional MerR regulator